jgi:hypothetical protein
MPVFFALLLALTLFGEGGEEAAWPSLVEDVAEGLELFVLAGDVDGSMLVLTRHVVVCALKQS